MLENSLMHHMQKGGENINHVTKEWDLWERVVSLASLWASITKVNVSDSFFFRNNWEAVVV